MNTLLAATTIVLAGYWFDGGVPMGPSGLPQREPFPITEEYKEDYAKAELCAGKPDGVDAVKEGEMAMYEVTGESVMVILDEFARRDGLDYCWL